MNPIVFFMSKTNENKLLSLDEFSNFLFTPIVPIQDIVDFEGEPINKLFPYWRRHGLLPFIPKGKWNVKISFSQLIWLRILDTFREFGVSLETSKKVCDYFFKDAYDDNLPKLNLLERKKILELQQSDFYHSPTESSELNLINQMLGDEILLYGLKFEINYLTKLITDFLSLGQGDVGFVIDRKGNVIKYAHDKYFSHRSFSFDVMAPHLRISISHYISEFVDNKELRTLYFHVMLNEQEKQVLKAMREKNVTINITKSDDQTISLKTTSMGTFPEASAKIVREVLGLQNYEEITINTRDEKTLTFKRTKKMNRLR